MRQHDDTISSKAIEVVHQISNRLHPCPDLRIQSVNMSRVTVFVLWLDSLVDNKRLQEAILVTSKQISDFKGKRIHLSSIIPGLSTHTVNNVSETVKALLNGCAIVCSDDIKFVQVWHLTKLPTRSVERPENEPTLNGPQEAFVENINLNISLLRKRLKSPELKIETYELGNESQTTIAILYHKTIAKESLVNEMRDRLKKIVFDYIVDINQIREFISDPYFSIFPTVEDTERPDRMIAGLMEGRVGLLVDGSPKSILVPLTFAMNLSSPEDYYMHYSIVLPLRLLRHLMFWVSVLLPALYVSLLTYNQDLLPTPLVMSVAAQHTGIPFPTVFEALGMMIAFEALREAGTRLPRAVGQSVSIVGTLIIGDAAVQAGLVSPGMVIIVSATGVASFTLPALGLVMSARLLQFPFVIAASLFGLFGVVMLGLVIVARLASLRSFGVPYLSPVAPNNFNDMKDTVIRAPWWMMQKRPQEFEPQNSSRMNVSHSKSRRDQG
ncbi:spore germination protein [Alicyclobacillus tolerans]|uniref:spore germination protein n=1 Tax=Alicyclobacillus tolerans TaxID=90970 RepID=UPI003B81739C